MRYVKRAVLVCGAAALLCWLFSVAAYASLNGLHRLFCSRVWFLP